MVLATCLIALVVLAGCSQPKSETANQPESTSESTPGPASVPKGDDDYPTKPIRWIVPVGAGGSYDRIARGFAPILSESLGVPVVVENNPGVDGWNQIYRANPDGYTIGIGDLTGDYIRALIQPPPYDLNKFTQLGILSAGINLLVSSAKSGINNIDDFKAVDRPLRMATFGGFATPSAQVEILASRLGVETQQVNFPGPSETVVGVVRGDVDLDSLGTNIFLDHIKAGDVVPLVVFSNERDPRLPDVPRATEVGVPEADTLMNYRVMLAPPGLPDSIKQKLVASLEEAMRSEAGRAFLEAQNLEDNAMFGEEWEETARAIESTVSEFADLFRRAASK